MTTATGDLEEMYSRMRLEEEEGGGVLIGDKEVNKQSENTFVLVGKFLREKNINFQAMQNVLASLWRPKEGMEIHDLGGQRYSFVFFHILDLQKVIEGGHWTFEHNVLIYKRLEENEDPHLIQLNKMDTWVQIYDLPNGMVSERILQSIGNYIGSFIKTDPNNTTSAWRMYVRIRVAMDVNLVLKRRMKVKREGGAWNWINFKYERLSTFCFVCGLLGHSKRDCAVVYANLKKVIEKAYEIWLRAPTKNMKNQNIGARWLRNGVEGGQTWATKNNTTSSTAAVHGDDVVKARFMEVDGQMTEIIGDDGKICYATRDLGSNQSDTIAVNAVEKIQGGSTFENETIVLDTKRKRVDIGTDRNGNGPDFQSVVASTNGPKNLIEAGPVVQARLDQ